MKHVIIVFLALALPAGADSLSDELLAAGILAGVPAEELPRYTLDRQLPDEARPPSEMDAKPGIIIPEEASGEEVELTRTSGLNGDQLALSVTEHGKAQIVAEFSLGTANPILLFFLENVVRNIAAQTGGSPFYIRNRIRDALVGTEIMESTGEEASITLQPFLKDPNKARLGEFANLAITFRYDPGQPGKLIKLLADTRSESDGYTETMTLIPGK